MGTRGSFRGLGFNPGQSSKVSTWLRLAASSQSGGQWTSITDVLNNNPATFNAARRTNVGASANGLPIQAFITARPSAMAWPLIAANNQTTRWGLGFWFRPTTVAGGNQTIMLASPAVTNGSSSPGKFNLYKSGVTLAFIVTTAASGSRQLSASVLAANTWIWQRWSWDSSRSGDDRFRLYVNGANVSGAGSYTDLGSGASFPTNLNAPTGNIIAGHFGDDSTGSGLDGDFAPNIYTFSEDLTTAEDVALMNFEAPT
jgi:hypothetical protein